jgi:hypothetical protein
MSNIKVGDILVCKDVSGYSHGMTPFLTMNKCYNVILVEYDPSISECDIITICDDSGRRFGYYDYRFIRLSDYRKEKLERLEVVFNSYGINN